MREQQVITALLIWLALFGLYPFAHPGHQGETALSRVDIAVHWFAIIVLLVRLIG